MRALRARGSRARRRGDASTTQKLIVVVGSTTYDGHQLYDQRLARALRESCVVVFAEPALPFVRVGRRRSASTDETGFHRQVDGLDVVVPRMLPFGRRPQLAPLTAVMVSIQLRVATWWLHRRAVDAVIVAAGHPLTVRTMSAGQKIALVKDDYVAGAGLIGEEAGRVRRRRDAMLSCVDDIVVVSPKLQRDLATAGGRVHLIPAGCERVSASPEVELAGVSGLARPRALFIGLISDRIDFAAVTAIARSGVSLVFVGGVQRQFSEHDELARLRESGQVVVLGPRSQADLAAIGQACDVGLVPYVDNDFNRASFPLKTLEYLAMGLPVVSSPLESSEWLADPSITVANAPEEFPGLVDTAARSTSGSRRATADRVLRLHSWTARTADWLTVLAGPPAPR